MIRKILGFMVAVGLVIASAYVLYVKAIYSDTINGFWILAAGFWGSIGLALLWFEYIRPLVGPRQE
jgi:hypothetical protein